MADLGRLERRGRGMMDLSRSGRISRGKMEQLPLARIWAWGPGAFLVVSFLVLTPGCGNTAGSLSSAGSGVDAGASPVSVTASGRAESPLSEGWSVFLPEDEFSTLFIPDGSAPADRSIETVGMTLTPNITPMDGVVSTEGIVLAGGQDGLYILRKGEAAFAELRDAGKSFSMVKAIQLDAAGRLWVGHVNGLTCFSGFQDALSGGLPLPGSGVTLGSLAGVKLEMINGLMADSKGNLYAGTFHGAVKIPEKTVDGWLKTGSPEGFAWMGEKDGLTSPMVNAMLLDRRGFRWFGAYIANGGGVAVFLEDTVQTFNHDHGLADDFVTTIAEDTDGTVWVGTGVYTTGGATRFLWKEGRFTPENRLTFEDGLAGEKVRHIHVDRSGNRWFCSEYDGIAIFNSEGRRIRLLAETDGLPDNEVKQMAEDGQGALWFACRRGLLRMDARAVSNLLAGPG